MTTIKEKLMDLNPWWKAELRIEYVEREIHKTIEKFITLPQILAFTGLRRVGKTTLMLKIAHDFIVKGLDQKRVIYFSFDEFKETEIRIVMREYEEIMDKDFTEGKYLLLLDEIQKVGGWEDQLKGIYDSFGKNVKIIISGSESLFIRKKSKETLSGRIFEFKIGLLSFKEFLLFREIDLEPKGLYLRELQRLFNDYIVTMGFPELVNVGEREVIRKYVMESIVEKIVYKDMPTLFGIKDMSIIDSLLRIIMEEPGQIVELSNLADELHISRQTLSNYLRYLEESFLIKKLYNFSKSRRKVERKLKKYYPTILSSNLLFREDELSKSKVFEWVIVTRLQSDFFWRDPYKNEVDMVLTNKHPMPVEIKYGKIDYDGLLAFSKKFKINEGLVISKTIEEKKKRGEMKISIIPAFKFLLE